MSARPPKKIEYKVCQYLPRPAHDMESEALHRKLDRSVGNNRLCLARQVFMLHPVLAEFVDELITRGVFNTRSEFYRQAVRALSSQWGFIEPSEGSLHLCRTE